MPQLQAAEPKFSSNQLIQINVRGKIANEISIIKVNCGETSAAIVGHFTQWVESVYCTVLFGSWLNRMK